MIARLSRITKSGISEGVARISFILLFPGFFFYHYAIGRGFIPPFLGGYFGVVALGLAGPLLYFYFQRYGWNRSTPVMTFYFILLMIFVAANVNFSLSEPAGYFNELYEWSMAGLLFNAVCLAIAAQIDYRKVLGICAVLLFAMSIIVALNVGASGIFYIRAEAQDNSMVATYQGFARSIAFPALILTACLFRRPIQFVMMLMAALVVLFLNGARTEFAAYLVSAIVFVFVFSWGSKKVAISAPLVLMVFASVAVYVLNYAPADSRMMQLFSLQSASSYEARADLHAIGLQIVSEYPLLGGYGKYTEYGGVGSYPHNLFSAWVNLGLLGFIAYLFMFFALVRAAFRGFDAHRGLDSYRVFLLFLIFTIAAVAAGKDYSYMAVGFLVGAFLNYMAEARRGKR